MRGIAALLCLLLSGCLAGCVDGRFNVPETPDDEAAYTALFPHYAEYCALSEISKKPGTAVDIIAGGPGGHSILYLNGVCRVRDAGYPEIALCPEGSAGDGVGLSVNAHYANALWVATEGRALVFRGGLAPGTPLTAAGYEAAQAAAKAQGVLDGVVFHPEVFAARLASLSERDYMYEVSIATDYAIGFGRDVYCAKVPMSRAKMAGVVEYLNGLQRPYRSGQTVFRWDVLRNNCAHTTHNALANVGVWAEWPVERPLLISAFDFPVPKNEFVNLMRRTNDMPIADPDAIQADDAARAALLTQGWLATRPGGLARAQRAIRPNAMYETDLRLIFYDEPVFARYQRRFDAIFANPRHTDLGANLRHFQALYGAILAAPARASTPAPAPAPANDFGQRLRAHIATEQAALDGLIARGTTR